LKKLIKIQKIIFDSPNSQIEILLEEFNEFGHSDSGCKFYLVYKYEFKKEKYYI
jgi:hypothetical protein